MDANAIIILHDTLGRAVFDGDVEHVKCILEEFPDMDLEVMTLLSIGYASPFFTAALRGWVDIMAILAARGASVTNPGLSNQRTPLYIASDCGKTEAVRWLLNNGAEECINQRTDDRHGATPLHIACQQMHTDVVRLLCEHGADVNISTVRVAAVPTGHLYAAPPQKDEDVTPLHMVCCSGNIDIVTILLDHGARVGLATRTKGISPLRAASRNGHTDVVKKLLLSGTDSTGYW